MSSTCENTVPRERCGYRMKHGKRGGQICGAPAGDASRYRYACRQHNPGEIALRTARATVERAERRAEFERVSPGPCRAFVRSGRRKGEVCGRLMEPGEEVCVNHTREKADEMREVGRNNRR